MIIMIMNDDYYDNSVDDDRDSDEWIDDVRSSELPCRPCFCDFINSHWLQSWKQGKYFYDDK